MSELRVAATNTGGGVDAYRYVQTVTFTSNGTFTKASYPWLRAMKVRLVGGGAAGSGASTTGASQVSTGGPGGAGAYAESFITDIAGLASSITVTIGSGGTPVSADQGNNGGTTSFGSLVSAGGGLRAGYRSATSAPYVFEGGGPQTTATGQITIAGEGGDSWFAVAATDFRAYSGRGGNSVFGTGGNGIAAGSGNGYVATGYGAGGGGAMNYQNQGTARTGGAGTAGVVFLELYA